MVAIIMAGLVIMPPLPTIDKLQLAHGMHKTVNLGHGHTGGAMSYGPDNISDSVRPAAAASEPACVNFLITNATPEEESSATGSFGFY